MEVNMEKFEITTMTTKGQVVIPQGVRQSLGIATGAKFAVVGEGDTIILKRLEMPSAGALKTLLAKSRSVARKSGLNKSDVAKALKAARKSR